MYSKDNRTVLTLDAGGTNFVFSAIRGNEEIVTPVRLDAVNDCIEGCLGTIVEGFRSVIRQIEDSPAAISFAFPGPADYAHGIIGDLPNFPCFRGGVALGPYLEQEFGLPVYINNDGALFAYGEALAGELPRINALLEQRGSGKRYKNLIGITLGTGFGGGVVAGGQLLSGDNGCGGSLWCMRNYLNNNLIAEESIGIRGVKRSYRLYANDDNRDLQPKDIFEIASGRLDGDRDAACKAFDDLGAVAGEALANAIDIADGIVVIGGGISRAHEYFMPAILRHLRSVLKSFAGDSFPIIQTTPFDLTSGAGLEAFLNDSSVEIRVPGSERRVRYEVERKTGITVSNLGTSKAVSLGAYAFALDRLDKLAGINRDRPGNK